MTTALTTTVAPEAVDTLDPLDADAAPPIAHTLDDQRLARTGEMFGLCGYRLLGVPAPPNTEGCVVCKDLEREARRAAWGEFIEAAGRYERRWAAARGQNLTKASAGVTSARSEARHGGPLAPCRVVAGQSPPLERDGPGDFGRVHPRPVGAGSSAAEPGIEVGGDGPQDGHLQARDPRRQKHLSPGSPAAPPA